MIPINRYMEYPQSFHGAHIPYPYQNQYPSWFPPQTTKSPGIQEPWLNGGGYGIPNVGGCHGCCNHGYPSSGYYNYRPPYAQLPPPPPHPYYRPSLYSPYLDLHSLQYLPPHYLTEKPKYEAAQRSHCCGCPNHTCIGKEDKGVKIEEPEVEKNENDSSKEKNPYPLLWVPPEYMNNRSASKLSESDPTVLNGWFPFDMKKNNEGSKSLDSVPKVWNGWYPFDLDTLKSSERDVHTEGRQDQKKDEVRDAPCPIIWMPVCDKQEVEKGSPEEKNLKGFEVPKMKYKIIPVNFPYNCNEEVEAKPVEDTQRRVEPKVKENEVEEKRIPVRELREIGKKDQFDDRKNLNEIFVKKLEEDGDNRSPQKENVEKRPSSPVKSKLPPVCLRVEPLSRRKTRSLSPPSLKEKVTRERNNDPEFDKQRDATGKKPVCNVVPKSETTKDVENQGKKISLLEPLHNVETKSRRTIDVGDGGERLGSLNEKPVRNVNGKNAEDKTDLEKETKEAVDKEKQKTKYSPNEAAVKIQSTYRGYEVRRWEPLKKLRQIAKVREQVNEVRNQVSALESSDMQRSEKQRVFISETIMSLLLQLDTIQGLHPSLREVRKSVARELVCLQEQLDALTTQNVEELISKKIHEEDNAVATTGDNNEATNNNKSVKPASGSVSDSGKNLLSGSEEERPVNAIGSNVGENVHQSVSEADLLTQPILASDVKDGDGKEILERLAENATSKLTLEEQFPSPLDKKDTDSKAGAEAVEAEFEKISDSREPADNSVEVANKETDSSGLGDVDFAKLEETHLEEKPKPEVPTVPLVAEPQDLVQLEEPHLDEDELKPEEPMVPLTEGPQEKLLQEKRDTEQPMEERKSSVSLFDADTFDVVAVVSPEYVNSAAEPKEVMQQMKMMEEEKSKATEVEAEDKADGEDMEAEVGTNDKGMTAVDIDNAMADSSDTEAVKLKQIDVAGPEEQEEVEASLGANVNEQPSLNGSEEEKKLVKENERLREMLEKLMKAGNEQLTVISGLNGRVKDLEKKLMKKQKLRMKSKRTTSRTNCPRSSQKGA